MAQPTTRTFTLNVNGVTTTITNIAQLQRVVDDLQTQFDASTLGTQQFQDLQQQLIAARSSLQNLTQATQAVNQATAGAGQAAGQMGGQFQNAFGILNLAGGQTAQVIQGVQGGFTQLTGTVGTVSKSFGGLKTAIAGTGIGLLLIAFSALIGYLTETQSGMDFLNRKTAALSAVFNVLKNVFLGVGKALFDALSNPKKALTDLVSFLESQVVNRLKAVEVILDGIINLDYKKIGDGFLQSATGVENLTEKVQNLGAALSDIAAKSAAAAQEGESIAIANQKIAASERELAVRRAESRAQVEGLKKASDDTTKSTQVRLAAAQQAASIEKNLLAEQLKLQQDKINLELRSQKLGENVTNEDKQRLADLRKERAETQQESLTLQTELQNKVNAINTESAAKAKSSRDATAAAELAALKLRADRELAAAQKGSEDFLRIQKEKLEIDQRETLRALDEKISQATGREKAGLVKQRQEVVLSTQAAEKKLTEDFQKERSQRVAADEVAIAQVRVLSLTQGTQAYTDALIQQNEAEQTLALSKIEKIKENEAQIALVKAQFRKKNEDLIKAQTQADLQRTLEDELAVAQTRLVGLKAGQNGYREARLAEVNAEESLELAKIDATKEGEAKRNQVVAEAAQRRREILAQDQQLTLDGVVQAYGQINSVIAGALQAASAAQQAALDAQLTQVESVIDSAKTALDTLNSDLTSAQNQIQTLTEQLLGAKGSQREKIIQQLEQQRAKEAQLATQKKAEDERIKKAEADKLKLEQKKQDELKKSNELQKVSTLLTQVGSAAVAVQAGVKAVSGAAALPFPASLPAIVAAISAVASAVVAAKSLSDGFAEGGYTGDGGKYEPAGVVHRGEYVIPAHIVSDTRFANVISSLESSRLRGRGYADGGFVTAPTLAGPGMDTSLFTNVLDTLQAQQQSIQALAERPIYTSRTDERGYDAAVDSAFTNYIK